MFNFLQVFGQSAERRSSTNAIPSSSDSGLTMVAGIANSYSSSVQTTAQVVMETWRQAGNHIGQDKDFPCHDGSLPRAPRSWMQLKLLLAEMQAVPQSLGALFINTSQTIAPWRSAQGSPKWWFYVFLVCGFMVHQAPWFRMVYHGLPSSRTRVDASKWTLPRINRLPTCSTKTHYSKISGAVEPWK